MDTEKISGFFPSTTDANIKPLMYLHSTSLPASISVTFTCALFNLVPGKGYQLNFKFFDHNGALFYHYESLYKPFMDVSSTESYADYLGTFQQLTTPFISFSETASQIKATVDLTDTKGNILDSAKTFVAVLSEESNAK